MLNKAKINKNAAEALKKKKELEKSVPAYMKDYVDILDKIPEGTEVKVVIDPVKIRRGKNVKS